jgi:hypothetical protein
MLITCKCHRFGVKLFLLSDCETGYVVDVTTHSGNETGRQLSEDVGTANHVILTSSESTATIMFSWTTGAPM